MSAFFRFSLADLILLFSLIESGLINSAGSEYHAVRASLNIRSVSLRRSNWSVKVRAIAAGIKAYSLPLSIR